MAKGGNDYIKQMTAVRTFQELVFLRTPLVFLLSLYFHEAPSYSPRKRAHFSLLALPCFTPGVGKGQGSTTYIQVPFHSLSLCLRALFSFHSKHLFWNIPQGLKVRPGIKPKNPPQKCWLHCKAPLDFNHSFVHLLAETLQQFSS